MYSENSDIVRFKFLFHFFFYNIWEIFRLISVFDDCLVKVATLQYFPLGYFARVHRVTDEAFIAET